MNTKDESIWQSLVEGREATVRTFQAFIAEGTDRVGMLRRGMVGDVIDRLTALGLFPYLEVSEQIQLFDLLLQLCLPVKYATRARYLIASLPRDWVLANVEKVVEPTLEHCDHVDYRMLFELYLLLDKNLALKLANRALAHPDAEIREAGGDYLEQLLEGRSGDMAP